MRLVDHADFERWVAETNARTGLPEAFVEKDYYVTEVLRTVVNAFPGAVIFKGGTSLSKGWHLIARFSEDVDILVRPGAVDPPWTSNGQIERGLKKVCRTIDDVPGMTAVPDRTQVSRPKRRAEFFRYDPRFPELPGMGSGILLEPGVGSGDWPTTFRPITSLVAETIAAAGMSGQIGVSDLQPFDVETLALGRTFIEKLFVVHAAVERHRSGERPIGRHARHLSDLAQLAEHEDVLATVDSDGYERIVKDVDRASREWHGTPHLPPPGLRFSDSSVFIPDDVFDEIDAEYQRECERLFFGRAYPSLAECQERLESLRERL